MRLFAVALAGLAVSAAVAVLLAYAVFNRAFASTVQPGVDVAGIDIGGMDARAARATVALRYEKYLDVPISLRADHREWTVTPRNLGARNDIEPTLRAALAAGQSPVPIERLERGFLGQHLRIAVPEPAIHVEEARVRAFVADLKGKVETPPRRAELGLQPGSGVVVLPARNGARLDVDRTTGIVRATILRRESGPIALAIEEIEAPAVAGDLEAIRQAAENAVSLSLTVQAEFDGGVKRWHLSQSDLIAITSLVTTDTNPPTYQLAVDGTRLTAWVRKIAAEVDVGPRDARIERSRAGLKTIRPAQAGRKVDIAANVDRVRHAITSPNRVVLLSITPVRARFDEATLTAADFPDLIEEASTVYGGTLPDRMFNVELATKRLNGVIVPPGATFSFNEAVGEVSLRAGYRSGYGITRRGDDIVTIPSEGGGICQVATTLFQSVFWSGLPIVERNWHLYWIPRYGTPPKGMRGLDATIDQVYNTSGDLLYAVDLRWRNSTGSPLIVSATTDGTTLRTSLWGVNPDWEVRAEPPRIERVVKSDARVFWQHDPDLPAGREIKIESAQDGFEATIVRTVTRGDRIVDETRLRSTYGPSRNVTLYGGPRDPAREAAERSPIADRPATPAAGAAGFITPVPDITMTPRPSRTAAPAGTGTPSRTTPEPAVTGTPRGNQTPTTAPSAATPATPPAIPATRIATASRTAATSTPAPRSTPHRDP
ncbi:MAG: hypothetical protein FJ033_01320 [Chloroflexi bacterium]|nr:hypothetical protein [Chloroflexota bacterium]